MNIIIERKILDVGEDHGNQSTVYRRMPGDGLGLCEVIHEASHCEQQHGKNQHEFLPNIPGSVGITLQEKHVKTY